MGLRLSVKRFLVKTPKTFVVLRRERDSNPRYAINVHTISNYVSYIVGEIFELYYHELPTVISY